MAYAAHQATIAQTLFLNLGYECIVSEIGSVLIVKRNPMYDMCNRSAKNKFDKARKFGLVAKQLPLHKLGEVYNFIHQSYALKNYLMSMTLSDLQKAMAVFPDRYLLFGVFNNNELVAASICIGVKKGVLYDFCHSHAPAYEHLSPVVLLIASIYEYCRSQKIKLLDVGTSALNGIPNYPLLHFKRMLGCEPTMKLTFEKAFDI